MKTVLFKGVVLNNAVVRCPNKGGGEKVVEFFKSKGFYTRGIKGCGFGEDIFYGCKDGCFDVYSKSELKDSTHIFELSDILEEEKYDSMPMTNNITRSFIGALGVLMVVFGMIQQSLDTMLSGALFVSFFGIMNHISELIKSNSKN